MLSLLLNGVGTAQESHELGDLRGFSIVQIVWTNLRMMVHINFGIQ